MSYSIVRSPLLSKLDEMTKRELRAYFSRFLETIPARVEALTALVRGSAQGAGWQADGSVDSLTVLGQWFAGAVTTQPLTGEAAEIAERMAALGLDAPRTELTPRTMSIATDVGIYLGQVMLRNHLSLRWDQPLGSRKFAFFGHPVLVEFTSGPLSPVWVVTMLAHGISAGKETGGGLRETYDIWAREVRGAT